MRLVEIKCKNCGADIKVNEKAKEAECEYCGSKFKIEESEMEQAIKFANKFGKSIFIGSSVFWVISLIIFIIVFFIISFAIYRSNKVYDTASQIIEDVQTTTTTETQDVLYNLSELTDEEINEIHTQSENEITNNVTNEMFSTVLGKEQSKMYLISDQTRNTLYDVYKVNYKTSFGNEENTGFKYVVVSYSNIYIKDNNINYDSKELDDKRTYIGSITVQGYDSLDQVKSSIENKKMNGMQLTEK